MSNRVTQADLSALKNHLNKITNSPEYYAIPLEGGGIQTQIGHFTIDYAYGGVNLERVMNDGGGVSCPLGLGHISKRELYNQIHAYIKGIEQTKNGEV